MSIAAGTRFDRYEIISLLGSGGMGEIYLAQDTRLNRKVAIKLLPDRYTKDPERLRRFEKEAQAASALNHPNIITIYEIGEAEGRHFIATEYIEGSTVRRRMAGGRLTTTEALDIAEQVVDALTAAHAAGIVHRDIKPENIMIRPDGYVKVLDFGLAKLTERPATDGSVEAARSSDVPETPTTADLSLEDTTPPLAINPADAFATIPAKSANETTPGIVMGTAQYMSPEQARGWRVDSRTDIFSFGIVLYEMLAGRVPFLGASSRSIVASILNNDPPPLSHYRAEIPEVLEWIVAKALVKDRDERYQTAKEMLNDLRRLQRRLGIEHELSRSRQFTGSVEATPDTQTSPPSGETTQELAIRPDSPGQRRTTSSLGLLPSSFSKSASRNPFVIAIVTALLMIAGFIIYERTTSHLQTAAPFQSMDLKRFTSSGKAMRAAISPDGKYVAHVLSDAGKQSLLYRQVADSNNVVIVEPAEVTYRGLTFSHDGTKVYYVVQHQNNPKQVLYQVPVPGGVSRKVLEDIDSPVAISPDGKRLAFVRRNRAQVEDQLIIANLNGSNERVLASRRGADFFWIGGPAWSPDGKLIACPAGTNTGGRHMYVAEVRVDSGQERPISGGRWATVGRVSWMRDGSGLVIGAIEQGSTLSQVWFAPYPKGAPRRITNDLNDYRDVLLTADSRALVTVQSEAHVNVWLMNSNDASHARQITEGVGQYNGVRGLTWTPDGQLVYVSRASGSQDIWMMDQNGENRRQLTTPETRADRDPAVSPDGRYIIFVSTRTNNSNIYRLDPATNDQKQLTSGKSEEYPVVSADSRWVIYTSTESIKATLWKVSIEGGEPQQLTNRLSQWPAVSPDGQKIACWYREEANAKWQIAIIPMSGGAPEMVIDLPPTADTPIPVRWMPDGRGISYVDTRNGVSNIWSKALDGGEPKQLTAFTADQISWFDWSRDGKQLACSRGRVTSDVVLISEK
jgi:serine/threonine protein kinase/dipeptidyl aminopeptidase/acylaminoacyl peptidase